MSHTIREYTDGYVASVRLLAGEAQYLVGLIKADSKSKGSLQDCADFLIEYSDRRNKTRRTRKERRNKT